MDIYTIITSKIIDGLEQAQRWQKPWTSAFGGGSLARPVNAITQRPYSGINVVMLWSSRQQCQQWATYRAWHNAGAQVRKGEKGTPIIFWQRYETDDEQQDGEDGDSKSTRMVARAYFVFSAAQVDGWKGAPEPKPATFDPIEQAEQFVYNTGITIKHGGDVACYIPALDLVKMPERAQFVGTKSSTPLEAYYGTLAHELTHATGHASRCARDLSGRFGNQAYAAEELIAELGAAFLCADLGIASTPRADHAHYIASWLKVLRGDKRAIITAASRAEQATRYLHGLQSPTAAAIAA